MQIILLERIAKLGKLGDIVNVKHGFAKNYLLPKKKALRATEVNKALFETQRADLESKNLENKDKAEKLAEILKDKMFIAVRSAGDTGHLYGSVSTRDIAELLAGEGFELSRTQIELNNPLKTIGLHNVRVHLHGDVIVNIIVNIARSLEEASKQTSSNINKEDSSNNEEEAIAEEQVAEEVSA